jgi:NADH-quinone oxidoreductase subunit N
MTRITFLALLPLFTLTLVALGLTVVIALYRHHRLAMLFTVGGLALSLLTLPPAAAVAPVSISTLLIVDSYALFYIGLIVTAALAVTLLAYGYLEGSSENQEEFYLLLLLATLGAAVLAASNHFASLFLGLETLSVALFALLAYQRHFRPSLEAGVKYLILSGVASALLLFGMALLYAELGTMEFARISAFLNASAPFAPDQVLFLTGVALILAGFGFKLSLVPFHLWTPDVYQGAPIPVTAFLATVSKGAVVALLVRFFSEVNGHAYPPLMLMLSLMALVTILAGNLLALLQNNIKRLLAYSSIAHLGYLLVALLVSGSLGVEAVSFYLVAYFIMNLGAFGIVAVLSSPAQEQDNLEDYQGLFWQRPGLAAIFTFILLSLAGIPLTIGFIGKFYIFAAGVDAALWLLLTAVVIGSILGLFYYLRVIIALYRFPTEAKESVPTFTPLLSSLRGLGFTGLALLLVSLASIPLTFGLLGKFYMYVIGIEGMRWPILFTLLLGGFLGVNDYLRRTGALSQLSSSADKEKRLPSAPGLSVAGSFTLVVLALLLLWWGIYPDPLMRLIESVAVALA